MIPKVIHFCWFGQNPKSKFTEKCIRSWEKNCPDYEIIEWNESNYDISLCPIFVQQAYKAKKWAFVTDYVRLDVIYKNGGIYFDTDVELIKPINILLDYSAFFGFEDDSYVATGLGFGATKGNSIIKEMRDYYDSLEFFMPDGSYNQIACPVINTEVLLKHGLVQNGKVQVINDDILILSSIYLCPMNYRTREISKSNDTIAIHWYDASWYSKEQRIYHDYRIRKLKLQKVFGNRTGEVLVKLIYRVFFRKERKELMKM